jgi:arabinogalactan endo-1,4-beta-galactosidase
MKVNYLAIKIAIFTVMLVFSYQPIGAQSTAQSDENEVSRDSLRDSFIIGADVSFVQEQEDLGFVFVDEGVEKDIFEILKDHGFNYIRLRIFHDPGQPDGYQFAWDETRAEPYCDLVHTIEMAQRAKAAGMRVFLDFHYSDTWAYPAEQRIPAAWVGLEFEALTQALYDYTRDTLLAFEAEGVLPDMVQVGNEITPGILHPEGHIDNWDQLAELLTAGIMAVKDVDPNILTVLHIDGVSDIEATDWWVGEAVSRGVPFDVMGVSAYYVFDGEPEQWNASLQNLATNYPDLQFIIAEYASHYREANDIVFNLSGGIGTFMWEPTEDGYWGEGLFDVDWETMRATTRDRINIYDQIALDYGLVTPKR